LAASKSDEIYTLLRSVGINVEATAKGNPLDRWLVCMALLTCTVGIANAMLMSVTERFREIGTMKCLGAENGTVVKLFLIESAMIGGTGSLAGILVGLLISVLAGLAQFGWFAVEYLTFGAVLTYAALAFLAGVVLCLIGAGYPALVASRMRPVEALRVEE
jgi:putative ABC transport system permease protein